MVCLTIFAGLISLAKKSFNSELTSESLMNDFKFKTSFHYHTPTSTPVTTVQGKKAFCCRRNCHCCCCSFRFVLLHSFIVWKVLGFLSLSVLYYFADCWWRRLLLFDCCYYCFWYLFAPCLYRFNKFPRYFFRSIPVFSPPTFLSQLSPLIYFPLLILFSVFVTEVFRSVWVRLSLTTTTPMLNALCRT